MRDFLRRLHRYTRHEEMILLGACLALAVTAFPLQHYMDLALWQHRALGLLIMSFFASIQVGISWKAVSVWGRLSLSCLALCLGVLGEFCWQNPWLGNLDLATSTQIFHGQIFAIFILLVVVMLLVVSLGWMFEKKLLKMAAQDRDKTEQTRR